MMFNTVILLVTTFCAANAAYTVSVYDDGQEPLSSESVSSCDYHACDQLCRRLGFPSGACVGDRCKCDNFNPAQEFIMRASDAKASCDCDQMSCNRYCLLINYTGGICLTGKCRCYK